MEHGYESEALRTERAWSLMRKIVTAEHRRADEWKIAKLQDALFREYQTAALLLSVDDPDVDIDNIIAEAADAHKLQMRVALMLSGQLNQRKNQD
jgi:hypothetical protein